MGVMQRQQRTDGPQNTPSKAAACTKEPTLSDLMTTLQTMNSTMTSKLDGVSVDVGLMREQFAGLQGEVKGLREEVSALRLENDELKQSNYDMKTRLEELERKTDDLDGRSKRNKLIFYGLPRQQKDTGVDCEDMLRDLTTDKLDCVQSCASPQFKAKLSCDCTLCLFQGQGQNFEGQAKVAGQQHFHWRGLLYSCERH